jgi:hypothetical protein
VKDRKFNDLLGVCLTPGVDVNRLRRFWASIRRELQKILRIALHALPLSRKQTGRNGQWSGHSENYFLRTALPRANTNVINSHRPVTLHSGLRRGNIFSAYRLAASWFRALAVNGGFQFSPLTLMGTLHSLANGSFSAEYLVGVLAASRSHALDRAVTSPSASGAHSNLERRSSRTRDL